MRRVDTTGTLRGGILTQASFLTATSSSENTSIVQRAKWCSPTCCVSTCPPRRPAFRIRCPHLTQALASPIAKPAVSHGKSALHFLSSNDEPDRLGLEVFGASASRAPWDHGKPIDSSGQLPDGQMFADTEGLLTLLKADPRFPVCLTRKVLHLRAGPRHGRPVRRRGRQSSRSQWQADNYDLKKQLVRIAQSDVFRTARVAGQEQAP